MEKLSSPARRRACEPLGQHRSIRRKVPRCHDDEEAPTAGLVASAEQVCTLWLPQDQRIVEGGRVARQ